MNAIARPPRVRLLLDETDLQVWLEAARPDDVLEYHRGALSIDRLPLGSRLGEADRTQLDRIAGLVFKLAASGRVHLLQRRHGDADYSYLVVARPSRRSQPNAAITIDIEGAR
jgi:hypothetical protein